MTTPLTNADPPENTPLTLAEIVGDAPAFSAVFVASNFDVTCVRTDGNYWLLVDTDSRDTEWHTLEELEDLLEFAVPLRYPTISEAELAAAITEWADADDELDAFALDQSNAYGDDHRAAESRLERAQHALHLLARNLKKPETGAAQ